MMEPKPWNNQNLRGEIMDSQEDIDTPLRAEKK